MNVSDNIVKRYSERFKKFGCDVKTLGWGSKEQQIRRFHEFTKHVPNIHNKSIIDIGCGLGDYYNFLGKGGCLNYLGLDINPDLIDAANENFKDNASVNFTCKDLLFEKSESPIANVGVMVGVLNLNLKDEMDNFEFSKKLIRNAFTYVNELLVVDFISSFTTDDYPEEDFIYYHKPQDVLEFCFSLTNNVSLFHNYQPIPQKEFLVCLQK